MPSRAQAIVRCKTCGVKWGNVDRALACEEMFDVEHALIAAQIDRMIRHFEIGHELELSERAPRSFAEVITEAARRVAAARGRGLPPVEESHDD